MHTQLQQQSEAINRYLQQYQTRTLATPALVDYHVHDNRSRDAPTATIKAM